MQQPRTCGSSEALLVFSMWVPRQLLPPPRPGTSYPLGNEIALWVEMVLGWGSTGKGLRGLLPQPERTSHAGVMREVPGTLPDLWAHGHAQRSARARLEHVLI